MCVVNHVVLVDVRVELEEHGVFWWRHGHRPARPVDVEQKRRRGEGRRSLTC
jgi:hypothetical protein